jgi:hypothetical protein
MFGSMYGAVLALISCAGAWVAWRRHPLYSPGATFRILAETLLLLIAAAAAIATTVHLTENKSVTVQMIALFSVIVLVTLAMIFSITAISTPKSAHLNTTLPPTTTLVNMYRRRVLHFLKVSLVFFAIVGAACLIPGPVRYISASLLGIGLLLGSIMLPTGYIMARKFDRAATAMTLHPWLHWHYAPQEWQAWKAASVERLQAQPATFLLKRDWQRLLWVSLAILIGTLLMSPGTWVERVGWAAACIAMVMGFIELAAWDARRAPRKLEARLERCTADAYFGADGMMCDGLFFTWLGADVYLTSASIDTRPPRSLMMQFEKIVPNPYGSPNIVKLIQGVLIPGACDPGDLTLLRTSLESRVPAAKIAL